MTKSLSEKFPKVTYVDGSVLDGLTEQFKDLTEKVYDGDYVIAANEQSFPDIVHDANDTILDVVIKPSEENKTSSVQSMTFKFKHKGYQGTNLVDFQIKTQDGATINFHYFGDLYGFLKDVHSLGYSKDRADAPNFVRQKKAIDAIKDMKL
jgi:hypothetical protein